MVRRRPLTRLVVVALACVLLAGCARRGDTTPTAIARVAPTPVPGALSLLTEPDQGVTPIYSLLDAAQHGIDLTMYELVDPQTVQALEHAVARGVDVRVILDRNREKSANQPAYDELTGHGVRVVWADSRYAATHEKAIVVDRAVAAVMSLNLTSRYYPDTRDYAVLDRQPADVAAIEQVFDADFRHARTTTPTGDDLVWSPGSQATLLALVGSATTTLLVENEEMALPAMTSALENAAERGVQVTVVMTRESDWADEFDGLVDAGVAVRTYAASASLYIHAKAIVVDAETAQRQAFVGSENFSAASLQRNRELGLLTADPVLIGSLARTIEADAEGATAWQP